MNKVIENIVTRRSCKSFQTEMVPDELIDEIVKAGLYAASGMGKQSPIILVVKDKVTRDILSGLNAKYDPQKRPDPFYNAPVVLAVLAPKDAPTGIYDGSLVISVVVPMVKMVPLLHREHRLPLLSGCPRRTL